MDVPLLARLFEGLVGLYGAFAAGAAHGQLHRHNGDAHDDKADEVEPDEVPAAVLAGGNGNFLFAYNTPHFDFIKSILIIGRERSIDKEYFCIII